MIILTSTRWRAKLLCLCSAHDADDFHHQHHAVEISAVAHQINPHRRFKSTDENYARSPIGLEGARLYEKPAAGQ